MQKKISENTQVQTMTRRKFLWLSSMTAAGFLTGCATNPVTGESQLMMVSEQQEIQMDRQSRPHQFSTDYGPVQDTRLNAYISQVGNSIARNTHRPRMPWSFRVVNATYVNAYAFPGGSIAATRGILLKMENEDELAGLIGHELGHVNARHAASRMSKSQLTQMVVGGAQAIIGAKYSESAANIAGQIGMLGTSLLLTSYSRDNERQADELGNKYMVQTGYNTDGFVELMKMLNNMSKEQPSYAQVLFSTHPMSSERYQTAVNAARTTYATSKNRPLNRERYMDNIASLRKIKDAIENMQKAETAMGKKQYGDAESLLNQAIRSAPRDYTAAAMMAKCKLYQEQYGEAERYANTAGQIYPTEAQAKHLSGFAKVRQRKYEAAYQDFTTCERLLPGNPTTLFFKGFCQEGMGRQAQAAEEYQKFLQSVSSGDKAQHAYKRLKEWGYIKS